MKNNLPFEFTVNKATKTVLIIREFAAELSLVWDAFTKQEILDQWWADGRQLKVPADDN